MGELFGKLGDSVRQDAVAQLLIKARPFDPSVRSGLWASSLPVVAACGSDARAEDVSPQDKEATHDSPTLLRGHKASLAFEEKAESRGFKISGTQSVDEAASHTNG